MTAPLRYDRASRDGASVLTPHGVLDVVNYGSLRDVLVKVATDEPRALIVDIDELRVPDLTSFALFSSVCEQLAQWPGVPLLLVADNETRVGQLAAYRMARYVPVFQTLPAATAGIDDPPPRRLARRKLPNSMTSAVVARRFVADICAGWGESERAVDAMMVANELVENTLLHTYCAPSLRLELRRDMLSVAVYDDDPAMARAVVEPDEKVRHRRGLFLVAQMSRAWGCTPTPAGGKVVWAVL